jgi:hypothetical protein
LVIEDVEARQFVQRDALVEHRVGLASIYLYMVTEVDKRLREVAGVDALTADVRFASVGEVGELERTFSKSVEFALHVGPRHAI